MSNLNHKFFFYVVADSMPWVDVMPAVRAGSGLGRYPVPARGTELILRNISYAIRTFNGLSPGGQLHSLPWVGGRLGRSFGDEAGDWSTLVSATDIFAQDARG